MDGADGAAALTARNAWTAVEPPRAVELLRSNGHSGRCGDMENMCENRKNQWGYKRNILEYKDIVVEYDIPGSGITVEFRGQRKLSSETSEF